MPPESITRLRHMRDAAARAIEFSQGRTRADLDVDDILALALARLIEIIGEAAGGVEDPVRSASPGIPWRQIIGARNRLIHGYFDVDLDVLWAIVSTDLPALIPELDALLEHSSR